MLSIADHATIIHQRLHEEDKIKMQVESTATREIRQHGPYTLYSVWPDPDQSTRQEIRDFWIAQQAMPTEKSDSIEHRSRQAMIIARESATHEMVGVSTALATPIECLGFPCYYYRTFVALNHRSSWILSKEIFLSSYALLNERFRQGRDADVLGLFIEVQNESLQKHLKYAVWALDGMNVVYIGKSATGVHRRVWYFDGAKIP